MKNSALITILVLIVIIGGWLVIRNMSKSAVDNTDISTTTDNNGSIDSAGDSSSDNGGSSTPAPTTSDIKITSPHSGDSISSPVAVGGQAKGTWFFEASAPVQVTDADGKILGEGHIQAQGEWMTTDYVPFTGSIEFSVSTSSTATTTKSGYVVFKNDNPSGDPAREKSFRVPVTFK